MNKTQSASEHDYTRSKLQHPNMTRNWIEMRQSNVNKLAGCRRHFQFNQTKLSFLHIESASFVMSK